MECSGAVSARGRGSVRRTIDDLIMIRSTRPRRRHGCSAMVIPITRKFITWTSDRRNIGLLIGRILLIIKRDARVRLALRRQEMILSRDHRHDLILHSKGVVSGRSTGASCMVAADRLLNNPIPGQERRSEWAPAKLVRVATVSSLHEDIYFYTIVKKTSDCLPRVPRLVELGQKRPRLADYRRLA